MDGWVDGWVGGWVIKFSTLPGTVGSGAVRRLLWWVVRCGDGVGGSERTYVVKLMSKSLHPLFRIRRSKVYGASSPDRKKKKSIASEA